MLALSSIKISLPKIASLLLTAFNRQHILQVMSVEANHRTPGQLIQELLDARGWTKRVLAIVLDIDETVINKIIAGKRSVTAEMALLLCDVFDVPVERFLELQNSYDLAKARIVSRPDPDRTTRAHLFGGLPIAEMIKRG